MESVRSRMWRSKEWERAVGEDDGREQGRLVRRMERSDSDSDVVLAEDVESIRDATRDRLVSSLPFPGPVSLSLSLWNATQARGCSENGRAYLLLADCVSSRGWRDSNLKLDSSHSLLPRVRRRGAGDLWQLAALLVTQRRYHLSG